MICHFALLNLNCNAGLLFTMFNCAVCYSSAFYYCAPEHSQFAANILAINSAVAASCFPTWSRLSHWYCILYNYFFPTVSVAWPPTWKYEGRRRPEHWRCSTLPLTEMYFLIITAALAWTLPVINENACIITYVQYLSSSGLDSTA